MSYLRELYEPSNYQDICLNVFRRVDSEDDCELQLCNIFETRTQADGQDKIVLASTEVTRMYDGIMSTSLRNLYSMLLTKPVQWRVEKVETQECGNIFIKLVKIGYTDFRYVFLWPMENRTRKEY